MRQVIIHGTFNLGDWIFNLVIPWKKSMLNFLASITRKWKYLFFGGRAVTAPSALALRLTILSPGFLTHFSSILCMLEQLGVSDKRWNHCPDHNAHWKYIPKGSWFLLPWLWRFHRSVTTWFQRKWSSRQKGLKLLQFSLLFWLLEALRT